jgi:hypothetical protein
VIERGAVLVLSLDVTFISWILLQYPLWRSDPVLPRPDFHNLLIFGVSLWLAAVLTWVVACFWLLDFPPHCDVDCTSQSQEMTGD